MPSDFLIDLIDHKKRVGVYLRKFVEKLFQNIIDQENGTDIGKMSLVDLAHMFCSARGFVHFDWQVARMLSVTSHDLNWTIRLPTRNETMQRFVCELFERAVVHDNSKFSPEEYEPYEQAFPGLQKYAYGTPEFKAELAKIKPAIQHHYKANRHHPEYSENGINGMDLLDVIEMTCDWVAASDRSQTDVLKGLDMNKERFEISDQLHTIIKNTVIALKDDDSDINKERQ